MNLVCGELGGFEEANTVQFCSTNSNEDVRTSVRGDDFVRLLDDDGINHIDTLLKSKYTAKDMGTLGFEE